MQQLVWVGAFGLLIALDAWLSARRGRLAYERRESEVSLGLAFGWLLAGMAVATATAAITGFAYSHRVWTLGDGPWAWVAVILAADFLHYWWHRLNHVWRWGWATHRVHHTAPRMNVLASFRQGWTEPLSGSWLIWTPLGFLGVEPAMLTVYFALLVAWEAVIHNEWAGKLGPLEWVFVTPSNHRVHHSLDPAHWDRNFGGVFIIWDRLFGTYVAEPATPIREFGLADMDRAAGPAAIAFHEWRVMWTEWRARDRPGKSAG